MSWSLSSLCHCLHLTRNSPDTYGASPSKSVPAPNTPRGPRALSQTVPAGNSHIGFQSADTPGRQGRPGRGRGGWAFCRAGVPIQSSPHTPSSTPYHASEALPEFLPGSHEWNTPLWADYKANPHSSLNICCQRHPQCPLPGPEGALPGSLQGFTASREPHTVITPIKLPLRL